MIIFNVGTATKAVIASKKSSKWQIYALHIVQLKVKSVFEAVTPFLFFSKNVLT